MSFRSPATPLEVALASGTQVTTLPDSVVQTDPANVASVLISETRAFPVGFKTWGPFYVGDRDFLQLYFRPLAALFGWYVTFQWQSTLSSSFTTRTAYDSYSGVEIADSIPVLAPYVSVFVDYAAVIPPAAVPSADIELVSRKGAPGLFTNIGNSAPLYLASFPVAAASFSAEIIVRPIMTGPAVLSCVSDGPSYSWGLLLNATNRLGNGAYVAVLDRWTAPARYAAADSAQVLLPGQKLSLRVYNAGALTTFHVSLLVPFR